MAIALTPAQRQFTKFVAVGIASNLTLYCSYLLLTVASIRPHAAMTITYLAAVLITYFLNHNWTFEYPGPRRPALIRYILVYVLGYMINFLMLSLMVDNLGYPHEVVQACLILFIATSLFLLQKFWVFDEARISRASPVDSAAVRRADE